MVRVAAGLACFVLLLWFALTSVVSLQQSQRIAAANLANINISLPAIDVAVDKGEYESLPFTRHALTGHAEEAWNARTISSFFDSKGCKPQVDFCSDGQREIHWCSPDNGASSIGLVIGHTVRVVVTGFQSEPDYWKSLCP